MAETFVTNRLMEHTSRIAAAYITQHKPSLDEMPQIIACIFGSLSELSRNPHYASRPSVAPAVPIEDSVQDGYIVCLEDGQKLHMLKRHLSSKYSMTLAQYRERWNLPHDYPMVSPSYTRRRSTIARTIELGKTRRKKIQYQVA